MGKNVNITLLTEKVKAAAGEKVNVGALFDEFVYASIYERRVSNGWKPVIQFKEKTRTISYDVVVHDDTTHFQVVVSPDGIARLDDKEHTSDSAFAVEVTSGPTPTPDPEPSPEPTGKLIYKVGLISDVHMDVDDKKNSEYKTDLKNALEYFHDKGCEFVSCAGDFAQYDDKDYDVFEEWYDVYGYAKNRMRLFACLGNHDYLRLFSIRQPTDQYADDGALYNYIGMWGSVKRFHSLFEPVDGSYEKDLHFFEHNVRWDAGYKEGWRTSKSKLCYWTEKHGDIYAYLSIDYGTMVYGDPWDTLARGINRLDYSDKFVQQMTDYVSDTNYNRERETNFDYRFYEPEALIWLKGLVEDNPDKRVFVTMHHPFPHKAGDSDGIYSHLRLWPVPTSPAVKQRFYSGSNTLCGLEFWFLDKLNNKNKNMIVITGHTHREWTDGVSVCKHDYPIRKPSGNEITPLVDNLETLNNTEYDYRLYTRASQTPCGDCGTCIGLPSVSKPMNGEGSTMYGASQGGIMEVYEDGVLLRCVVFKREGESTYCNEVIKTVVI